MPYRATEAAARYDFRLPVSVMLDNVRSLYNVGSFFRTADGVGVERIYLTGITGRPPSNAISKTALGAEDTVPWECATDAAALADQLLARGFEVAAIETNPRAVDLFDWQPRFPVCLIFGHEVEGVRQQLLDRCDTCVRIPMLGLKHSLNVATAGGVALYELLRKYRRLRESAT